MLSVFPAVTLPRWARSFFIPSCQQHNYNRWRRCTRPMWYAGPNSSSLTRLSLVSFRHRHDPTRSSIPPNSLHRKLWFCFNFFSLFPICCAKGLTLQLVQFPNPKLVQRARVHHARKGIVLLRLVWCLGFLQELLRNIQVSVVKISRRPATRWLAVAGDDIGYKLLCMASRDDAYSLISAIDRDWPAG